MRELTSRPPRRPTHDDQRRRPLLRPTDSTRPRLGAIIAVGVAFAILQTCLIATFPLLEGTELRSRVQSAVVSALDFPLGLAQPVFAAVAGSSGGRRSSSGSG